MKASISYQTLQVPPPFSFAYTLDLQLGASGLKVDFQLEYLNRDTVTEEEILNEGFSPNDDFAWKGELGSSWVEHLKPLLESFRLGKPGDNDPFWIHIQTNKQEGNVKDLETWDFLLQELIQAIYEKADVEMPLKIRFIHRLNGKSTFYELEGSFTDRTCKVNEKTIPWEVMQTLMSELYSMDFHDGFEQKPGKDGLWVDPDGLSGYQRVVDMDTKHGAKVEKTLLSILSG